MAETGGKSQTDSKSVRNQKEEPASPGDVFGMEPNYSGEMEYIELKRSVCYSEELSQMSDISSGPGPVCDGDPSRLTRKDQQNNWNQEAVQVLSQASSSQTTKTDGDEVHKPVDMNEIRSLPESVESLLKINRILQRQMSTKLSFLRRKLNENLEKQTRIAEEIEEQRQILGKDLGQNCPDSGQYVLRSTSFAVPYFKDRSHNAPPLNEDAKLKIDRGCVDLHTTRLRPWSIIERETLLEGVLNECKDQILNFWSMKVKDLERCKKKTEDKKDIIDEIDKEIESCTKEIKLVETADRASLVFGRGVDLDWLKVAAQTFNGLRSPEECKAQWDNYVHPSINKEPWTEDEDVQIKLMVEEQNGAKPKWQDIAVHLNTGRTAFQVMQRWVSYILPTLEPAQWNADNTQRLIDTVNMLRIGTYIPWPQVHQHLMGFSRSQLQSRWRVINPEVSKGPFTVEEDFLLIKGLYKFGLRFEMIAHFMPGRDRVQVRTRYKRTILPGLTTRIWQRHEDDKLIQLGRVGPYKWKQVKEQLTGRDPCEVRCRYHTIHVWQNLMGTNKRVPPLFPLVVTADRNLIEEVRHKLIEEGPGLKDYIDEARASADIKKAVKDLEKTRLAIKERKSDQTLRRLGRAINRRGRKPFTQPTQSWPDRLLTEYFLPSRNYPALPSIENDDDAAKSIQVLSSSLHLRILEMCSSAERQTVKDMSLFIDADLDLIPSLLVHHNHPVDVCDVTKCPACQRQSPASIPMIPPNQTTAGALRSLLFHRPKLEEIAMQEFVVLKLPPEELRTLGNDYKIFNKIFRKHFQSEPSDLQGVDSQGSDNQTEEEWTSSSATNTEQPTQIQGNGNDTVLWKDGSTNNPVQIQVDIGTITQPDAVDKNKIHIKFQESNKMKRKKEQPAAKKKRKTTNKSGRDCVTYGSKKDGGPGKSYSGIHPGGSSGDSSSLFRTPSMQFGNSKQESAEVTALRKLEDKLLFHRFLALFFWPSLMTITGPPEEKTEEQQSKICEIKRQFQKGKGDVAQPLQYRDSILPTLNIKDQEKLIETLEKKRKDYAKSFGKQRSSAAKRKCEDSSPEISDVPGTSDASGTSDAPEYPCISTSKKALIKEGSPKLSKTAAKADRKKSEAAAESSEPTEEPIRVFNQQKKIVSLKRSLVMKKVWDARRTGALPMRTNDRTERRYEPKPSRTRDSRRLDMLRPEKKQAKPWNLPPDGPMRVEPMVDVNPDKE